MQKRRGILLLVGLAVLATVSIAATIEVLQFRLPNPQHADREGLFRWLVTTDLKVESQQTRHQLIERLEVELDKGIDFSQIQTQLDVEQKSSLLANTDILLGEWYCLKCEEFHATPTANKSAMLDRRIEQVERWGILEDLFMASNSGASNSGASNSGASNSGASNSGAANSTQSDDTNASLSAAEMLEAFMARTDHWTNQAEAQQRDSLRQFTVAIKGRLFVRALRELTQGL